MSDFTSNAESCVVCGKPTDGGAEYAHLYHDGRRFSVCCPMCVEMFLRAPDRFARGEHPQTLVQKLLEEIRWRDTAG